LQTWSSGYATRIEYVDRRRIGKSRRRFALSECGPYRDRTCDLGIKSPLLYQLS
jgi:hypothetical protein